MIFKMDLSILSEMWLWFAQDLIGNEFVAVTLFIISLIAGMALIRIPKQIILPLMLPVFFGFTMMGYLTWLGWLIIGLTGLIFGAYILRVYGVL